MSTTSRRVYSQCVIDQDAVIFLWLIKDGKATALQGPTLRHSVNAGVVFLPPQKSLPPSLFWSPLGVSRPPPFWTPLGTPQMGSRGGPKRGPQRGPLGDPPKSSKMDDFGGVRPQKGRFRQKSGFFPVEFPYSFALGPLFSSRTPLFWPFWGVPQGHGGPS